MYGEISPASCAVQLSCEKCTYMYTVVSRSTYFTSAVFTMVQLGMSMKIGIWSTLPTRVRMQLFHAAAESGAAGTPQVVPHILEEEPGISPFDDEVRVCCAARTFTARFACGTPSSILLGQLLGFRLHVFALSSSTSSLSSLSKAPHLPAAGWQKACCCLK